MQGCLYPVSLCLRDLWTLLQQPHEPPPADMAPVYDEVCSELGVGGDAEALQQMRERNAKQLAEMEEKIKDAGKMPYAAPRFSA